jgi:hypothetical protein
VIAPHFAIVLAKVAVGHLCHVGTLPGVFT